MNVDGKSHDFVILTTQANKTATAVAETDEGRKSLKGSAIERRRCTGHRAGRCISSTTRWPRVVSLLSETFDPTEEPYEVVLHVRICEGGGLATAVPTAIPGAAPTVAAPTRSPSERNSKYFLNQLLPTIKTVADSIDCTTASFLSAFQRRRIESTSKRIVKPMSPKHLLRYDATGAVTECRFAHKNNLDRLDRRRRTLVRSIPKLRDVDGVVSPVL